MKPDKEIFAEMLNMNEVPAEISDRMRQTYAALPQKRRARRKPLRTILFAAAAICVLATGVFAAQEIYKMMKGNIPFYAESKPAQPIDSIKAGTESYNAEVNQTVTDAGISVTLENVSIDESFINAYFTIKKDGGLNLENSTWFNGVSDISLLADEWKANALMPHFMCEMDGKQLDTTVDQNDSSDTYIIDESTFKYMVHYAVADALPQQFTLNLYAFGYHNPDGETVGNICGTEGKWAFNINVDISETIAATKEIKPQEVSITTQDGVKTLDLRKFTVAPSGTVAVYGEEYIAYKNDIEPYTLQDGTVISTEEGYNLKEGTISLGQLAMRDDKGNWLYVPAHGGSMGRDFNVSEITGLAPDATAITFIPIIYGENTEQTREVLPLEKGQKNSLDTVSGTEIISVEYTDYGIKIVSRPYGNLWVGIDFLPCDANGTEPMIHGYTTSSTDRTTGETTTIIGAYNAEDIAKWKQCTHFISRYTTGVTLDEANAVTLPLE